MTASLEEDVDDLVIHGARRARDEIRLMAYLERPELDDRQRTEKAILDALGISRSYGYSLLRDLSAAGNVRVRKRMIETGGGYNGRQHVMCWFLT